MDHTWENGKRACNQTSERPRQLLDTCPPMTDGMSTCYHVSSINHGVISVVFYGDLFRDAGA